MGQDFDTPLALRGAHAQKWDNWKAVYPKGGAPADTADVIPMWVADMDFAAAPAIRAAIAAEAERGYFGYFGNPAPVVSAVTNWLRSMHGWEADPDTVRFTSGVIGGFTASVEAFSAPGDAVILFAPVYHSFYGRLRAMGREIVESPLRIEDGRFLMDLDALGAGLSGRERIVVLCQPHNPGGRIWSAAEIAELAEFCARHDLILVSDEIHMDLCFPGARHVAALAAAPAAADRIVVLTAASKGFNVAGGETAVAIVPDAALRARLDRVLAAFGTSPNRFGMLMLKAAFTEGADWSLAVRGYLAENFRIWRERVGALPGVRVIDMEATYLTWVDFRDTGIEAAELHERVGLRARIAASPGTQFGRGGEGHLRFNIAMRRALLEEAASRLEAAFADLQ